MKKLVLLFVLALLGCSSTKRAIDAEAQMKESFRAVIECADTGSVVRKEVRDVVTIIETEAETIETPVCLALPPDSSGGGPRASPAVRRSITTRSRTITADRSVAEALTVAASAARIDSASEQAAVERTQIDEAKEPAAPNYGRFLFRVVLLAGLCILAFKYRKTINDLFQ